MKNRNNLNLELNKLWGKKIKMEFKSRINGLGEIYEIGNVYDVGEGNIPSGLICARDYFTAYLNTLAKKGETKIPYKSYVSEKVLYLPKIGKKILIKDDVKWREYSYDYGGLMDYFNSLPENEIYFIENQDPISFDRFGEEGLTRFLFGKEAEEIGTRLGIETKNEKGKLNMYFIQNDKDLKYAVESGVVSLRRSYRIERVYLNKMKNFSVNLNLSLSWGDLELSGKGNKYGNYLIVKKNPRQGKNGGNVIFGDLSPYLNNFVKGKEKEKNLSKIKDFFEKNIDNPVLFVEHNGENYYKNIYLGKISRSLDFSFESLEYCGINGKSLSLPLEDFVSLHLNDIKGEIKDSQNTKLNFGFDRGSIPTLNLEYPRKMAGSIFEKENKLEIIVGNDNIEKRLTDFAKFKNSWVFESYFKFLEKAKLHPSEKFSNSLKLLRFSHYLNNYFNKFFGSEALINLLGKEKEMITEFLPGKFVDLMDYSKEIKEDDYFTNSPSSRSMDPVGPGYWLGGQFFDLDGMPARD